MPTFPLGYPPPHRLPGFLGSVSLSFRNGWALDAHSRTQLHAKKFLTFS